MDALKYHVQADFTVQKTLTQHSCNKINEFSIYILSKRFSKRY